MQDLRPPVQDLALLAALVSSMIAKACTLHASPVPRCARVLALPHCAAPQAADSYCTYGVVVTQSGALRRELRGTPHVPAWSHC